MTNMNNGSFLMGIPQERVSVLLTNTDVTYLPYGVLVNDDGEITVIDKDSAKIYPSFIVSSIEGARSVGSTLQYMLGTGFSLDVMSWRNYIVDNWSVFTAEEKSVFSIMLADFIMGDELDVDNFTRWSSSYQTNAISNSNGLSNRIINKLQ